LLRKPARAAARAVARQRLERAVERAAPLVLPTENAPETTIGNEEVHDFRVALRRLRSWLRAAGDLLNDSLPKRDRSALRRIARRAGAARDAQVEWQWLTNPGVPFSAPAARAARWLAGRRLAVYADARVRLQRRAAAEWPELAASVAAALAQATAPAGAPPESLGAHLAEVMDRHLQIAHAALDRIEHRTQVKLIHNARIEVKRLRYLVESVDAHGPAGVRALRHLRQLQDTLGELHDAHVITLQLNPLLIPHRGRRRPDGHPSLRDLRALRAAVRRRELAAFRRAIELLSAPASAAAWRVLDELPARLAASGTPHTPRRPRTARLHPRRSTGEVSPKRQPVTP
jgi:CHAD domain-containing protein